MGDFFDDLAAATLVGDQWRFEPTPADKARAASAAVARYATDTTDAALLLDMLGLTEAAA